MNESVRQKNVKIYMLFSYPACHILGENKEQRFSWLNCALQGIEAMFWVSMRPV